MAQSALFVPPAKIMFLLIKAKATAVKPAIDGSSANLLDKIKVY